MDSVALDSCLSFSFQDLPVRGRIVRLSTAAGDSLQHHTYNAYTADILLQSLAMTALFSTLFKADGVFKLQLEGAGYLPFVAVDADSSGHLRGYARIDESHPMPVDFLSGLPKGRLCFTLDQGKNTDIYQGITVLSHQSFADSIVDFFRHSEQQHILLRFYTDLDTPMVFAIFLQQLPLAGFDTERLADFYDHWHRLSLLIQTLSPAEMGDSSLPLSSILWRLFHTDALLLHDVRSFEYQCRCSLEKAMNAYSLANADSAFNHTPDIVCSFCGKNYTPLLS